MSEDAKNGGTPWIISVVLLVLVGAVYWPVAGYDFINFEDPEAVAANLIVQSGIHGGNVGWAFKNLQGGAWHPLTWMSWMLTCDWLGASPRGHHLVNLALHAANAVLLFWVLLRATRHLWPAGFVALLFAAHPLNVEPVAWIAERETVLGLFFALISTLVYLKYAEKVVRPVVRTTLWYVLSLAGFCLALMSSPAMVAWPFALLLLDIWPLNRLQSNNALDLVKDFAGVVLEKVPFLAGSIVALFLSFKALALHKLAMGSGDFPFLVRLADVPIVYLRYLGKFFWPEGLSVMYPMLAVVPVLFVIVAVISLVSVTAFIVSRAGQKGYLLVGWLWFLLLLLPVIGLVQIREQPIADRSLYAPMIGLGIMLAWTARDFITQRPGHARLLGGIGAAAVLACAVASFFQLKHWETSLSLFSHAVKVTQNNVPALTQLGNALASAGRVAEGRAAVAASARISPNRVESMLVAASICQQENQLQQAMNFYTGAINLRPESAETHLAVGTFLDQVSTNKTGALYHLSQAVKLRPEYPEALNNLAWMLATAHDEKIRNGKEAVRLAREACALTGYRIPALIGTLAACHAEAGKFPQAVSAAKQAIELAEKQGFKALADQNRKLLELYQAEKTVRQPPPGAQ